MSLVHRYCDPGSSIRKKLGVAEDEADIYLRGRFQGLDEKEVQTMIGDDRKKREQYWVKEIKDLGVFPVLFICGANHTLSFADMVSLGGLSGEVLCENWSPSGGRLNGV